jgi:hypothetical protein
VCAAIALLGAGAEGVRSHGYSQAHPKRTLDASAWFENTHA